MIINKTVKNPFRLSKINLTYYQGTMKAIVYIYIVSIFLMLIYTGFVYFITVKYQPRDTNSDGSKFVQLAILTYRYSIRAFN